MSSGMHYFSLKFKGGNSYHLNGERLKLKERIVNIGETADCDVRYECKGNRPEYYAAIIRNDDGSSWRIVKRSQYVSISIQGHGPVGYAYPLKDGDIILFDGQPMALAFSMHDENSFGEDSWRNLWSWAFVGMFAATFLALFFLYHQLRSNGITVEDVKPLEESILLLKVDSVHRLLVHQGKEKLIPPAKVLTEDVQTGTAFLTTDGKLITARHCVEYWIGHHLDLNVNVADLKEDDIIRWAIEAETFNQQHLSDSMMQLRVFFSLYDHRNIKKYSFASTDRCVHINTERDGVFLLSDFSQDYYWRTIRQYFIDRQMEMDDILWIDSMPEKGTIPLAGLDVIQQIKKGTRLMVCGYPQTGIGDKRMIPTEGVLRYDPSIDYENLFFDSNINHGFSGGPVMVKLGHDIMAIGVVSRVDSVSNGLYKWAVPVTEVKEEQR